MSAREYAVQLLGQQRDPRSFTDYALRTRTPDAFDVLAFGASHGRRNYPELMADTDQAAERDWFLELARLVALSPEPTNRFDTTRVLIESVLASTSVADLPEESRILYGQVLVKTGQFGRARRVRPRLRLPKIHAWALDADLANPDSGAGHSHAAWARTLNSLFTKARLEEVTVDREGTRFAGLRAAQVPRVNGPLVSVVMPAHDPDETIITSVRSILDQSWANIELIIVDDASPEHGRQWIREAAALDSRVRVIELRTNAGTYAARNAGIDCAEGMFVTFQDTDDWSHPRRIEFQVCELLEDPDVLASRSWAVRAYPDLTFTYVGYPANRTNASSLLYRREKVHGLVGRFDDVRKSGDVEFAARLRAAAPGSIRTLDESLTLAITQLRSDSLSRSDAVPGWTRWNRITYRDAYTEWHRHVRAGTADPKAIGGANRPFPLPERSWRSSRSAHGGMGDSYDLLLVSDWRVGQGPQLDAIRDIAAARRLGLRVAIASVEAPTPIATRREAIQPEIQALINDGTVEFRHLEESFRVRTVLIVNHASFRFTPGYTVQVDTERVLVMAASGPGGALESSPEACTSNLAAAFGGGELWIARDDLAIENLRHAGVDHVSDELLPYDVMPLPWVRPGRTPGRPVVGRPANGHLSLWPSTEEDLRSVYPVDDEFDVRVLGDVRKALGVLKTKTLPPNWTTFRAADLPWSEYLTSLDFFVYYPGRLARRDAHSSILDAIAAGCVVVLPPRLAPLYGDAAVYCEPADVAGTLRKLTADHDAYRHQRELARRFARNYPSFEDAVPSLFDVSALSAEATRVSATR